MLKGSDTAALFSLFRQEEVPPPPIVINMYSDEQLRVIVKRMRERLQLYKEKVSDPFASSPEISPPVSEYKQIVRCIIKRNMWNPWCLDIWISVTINYTIFK